MGIGAGLIEGERTGGYWRQYHNDLQKTGFTENTPATDGDILWQSEMDDGIWAGPVVAEEIAYYPSTSEGTLYAFSTEDGSTQWTFDADDWIYATPAVEDGTVYLASLDNYVYALDAADGSEEWSFESNGDIYTPPTVYDGKVYVLDYDYYMWALDTEDGSVVWSRGQEQEPQSVVDGAVMVKDDVAYIGTNGGYVRAIDASNGDLLWSWEPENASSDPLSARTAVVYYDDTLFVGGLGEGDQSHLFAIDPETQQTVWDWAGDELSYATPAVGDGSVYVPGYGGTLYALDAGDGSEQWSTQVGDSIEWSSPAVAQDYVYVGADDLDGSTVYCIDRATGDVVWDLGDGEDSYSSPAVVDGTVYTTAGDQALAIV